MAKAQTMHGSRAQVAIVGEDGTAHIIGIFNQVSWGVRYDSNPVHLLGRFSAAEIVLTGMEPVTVSCSGFRVVNNGPYKVAGVPKLQELLNHEDITISVFDRITGKALMTVIGVRPTGWNTQVAARGLADLSVEFVGLRLMDESDDSMQDESEGATPEFADET